MTRLNNKKENDKQLELNFEEKSKPKSYIIQFSDISYYFNNSATSYYYYNHNTPYIVSETIGS